MNCLYCKRENIDKHHHCKEQILFNKDLDSFLRSHTKAILEDWNRGSGNFAGAEDLAKKYLRMYTDLDITWYKAADYIRLILKENNQYTKSSKQRVAKMQKTMLKRYGVINNGQLPSSRRALSERNNKKVYRVSFMEDFKRYSKRVTNLTSSNRRKMEKPYRDYYTDLLFPKDLSDPSLMQGDLYPTIDHKLSVLYCYLNKITAEECSSLANLAWTFRYINSIKQHLTESQFRESSLPFLKPLLEEELIKRGTHENQ